MQVGGVRKWPSYLLSIGLVCRMEKAAQRLTQAFPSAQWPSMPCPTCADGRLAVAKTDDFVSRETGPSRRERDNDFDGRWDPFMWEGRFSAILTCGDVTCGEIVVASGSSYMDQVQGRDGRADYEEQLRLRFVTPPLRLLNLPDGCPKEVKAEVDAAFALIWTDPGGAGARLRVAVERVLDHQKVKKVGASSKRGNVRLSAHERILMLAQQKPEPAELLEAVKWLGNEASHIGSLSAADFLDGADIFEQAVRLLYDKRQAEIQKKAKAINQRKGPVKKSAR